jgi:hypothetical protein
MSAFLRKEEGVFVKKRNESIMNSQLKLNSLMIASLPLKDK